MKNAPIEVSFVMPCLNEEQTVGVCVEKALKFATKYSISAEVIVSDNGSTDNSRKVAEDAGAIVVDVKRKGYGAAISGGIKHARGTYIIMGDADDSYDFENPIEFVTELRNGSDLVMGNRFKGGVKKNAMPLLHQYLGNPVLSFIGRLFFKSEIRDFHCGLRGFRRDSILKLNLTCPGMEFASEMVVKGVLQELAIVEVPTTLKPDGRDRAPHLNTWRDGWRHLKFLLIYSPKWLFLLPGLLFFIIGWLGIISLSRGPISLGAITIDYHTMLYACGFSIFGLQMIVFSVFSKVMGGILHLWKADEVLRRIEKSFSHEFTLIFSLMLLSFGIFFGLYAISQWTTLGFGPVLDDTILRSIIFSIALTVNAGQLILSWFFLNSILLFNAQDN